MTALTALLVAVTVALVQAGHVKLSEGVDRPTNMGMGGVDINPLPYAKPSEFEGPRSLFFLTQNCFKYSADRWDYEVCPFNNVTQKRVNGYQERLMGVWGHWLQPDPVHKVFNHMIYSDGKGCNSDLGPSSEEKELQSTTHVTLLCDATDQAPSVRSVEETSHCVYNVTLSLPISCDLLTAVPRADLLF